MTTIECDNLTVRIAGRTIFEHVDLHISEGGMVALTGPSGCGKTTLLHTLGLLQEADGGRLMIDRENVTHATARRRRRFWHDTASFILQDYGIMDEESVAQCLHAAWTIWTTCGRGPQTDTRGSQSYWTGKKNSGTRVSSQWRRKTTSWNCARYIQERVCNFRR